MGSARCRRGGLWISESGVSGGRARTLLRMERIARHRARAGRFGTLQDRRTGIRLDCLATLKLHARMESISPGRRREPTGNLGMGAGRASPGLQPGRVRTDRLRRLIVTPGSARIVWSGSHRETGRVGHRRAAGRLATFKRSTHGARRASPSRRRISVRRTSRGRNHAARLRCERTAVRPVILIATPVRGRHGLGFVEGLLDAVGAGPIKLVAGRRRSLPGSRAAGEQKHPSGDRQGWELHSHRNRRMEKGQLPEV